VVGYRFAGVEAEAAPPRARGGLEALEEVEEGERGGGGFGVSGGEFGEGWWS
jgi:hypothetical protein